MRFFIFFENQISPSFSLLFYCSCRNRLWKLTINMISKCLVYSLVLCFVTPSICFAPISSLLTRGRLDIHQQRRHHALRRATPLKMTADNEPRKNGVANKVALVALGCPKNTVDAEVMLGDLQKRGFSIVRQPKDADVGEHPLKFRRFSISTQRASIVSDCQHLHLHRGRQEGVHPGTLLRGIPAALTSSRSIGSDSHSRNRIPTHRSRPCSRLST